jgi:hypothetical protein
VADEPEDDLAVTRRHVLEGEERVARQLVLIKKLDLAGRHEDARAARELLGTLTETLNAERRHLQIEMEAVQRRR